MRSEAAADRLLEDSWQSRPRRLPRRELLSEVAAAVLFLVTAGGLLLLPGATSGFDPGVAVVLVAVYVVLAGIEFPVGAGNVLPTQLVLVPMLVLLPPATVPLVVAVGLLLARLSTGRRGSLDHLLFSIPDGWHAVGPAVVLLLAGAPQLDLADLPLLVAAFVGCCLFDAGSAMLREAAARGVAPSLQLQVLALVWVVDACLAPIGFLAAEDAASTTSSRSCSSCRWPDCWSCSHATAASASSRPSTGSRSRCASAAACSRRCVAWATRSPPSSTSTRCWTSCCAARSRRSTPTPAAWRSVDREPRRLPEDSRRDLGLALGAPGRRAGGRLRSRSRRAPAGRSPCRSPSTAPAAAPSASPAARAVPARRGSSC